MFMCTMPKQTREEVDPLLVNDSETGPGAVFSMPRFEAMHSFDATPVTNSTEILYGVPKNGMTWLPMRFTAEQTPRTHAQMRVYIVNPYSQNREQAMAYLACVAQRETDAGCITRYTQRRRNPAKNRAMRPSARNMNRCQSSMRRP